MKSDFVEIREADLISSEATPKISSAPLISSLRQQGFHFMRYFKLSFN